MRVTKFAIGQRFFQASLIIGGREIDNGTGSPFTTFEEAEADALEMGAAHDPEAVKRGLVLDFVVREMEIASTCEDEPDNFGSAFKVQKNY